MSNRDDRLDALVLTQLRSRLSARASDVVSSDSVEENFVAQVRSILAEARESVRTGTSHPSPVSVEYVSDQALAQTGQRAADRNQHPAEALMAAEVLFDEAISPLLEWANASTMESMLRVTRALHRAIWRRFPPGAIAYTESLRQKLSTANLDSRLRLSRDLHDRVAQNIAAGLQRIELFTLEAIDVGENDTAAKLTITAEMFRGALSEIQDMTVDLRTHVGDRALSDVVRTYLADTTWSAPAGIFSETGDAFMLTMLAGDEILAIVLEALHNARRHAVGATKVLIHFEWQGGFLTIDVTDDGEGFDPKVTRQGALGLVVMAERADSIGAIFDVSTEVGLGTRVRVIIPQPTARSW